MEWLPSWREMSTRPSVPAELRRRVLVESGDRCAVHTCQHSDVDVHHIIPWEKCQDHSYDNLIALCPNCHRRADSGEIDRKSLRLYKARVAASFGISIHQPAARQFSPKAKDNPIAASWNAERIQESYTEYPPYELDLEFPQFVPEDADIADLNSLQRLRALERLTQFRTLRLWPETPEDNWREMATATSTLSESFEVACFTSDVVSIRYSVFHYGAGAAHPNNHTRAANYQRKPLIALDPADIFVPDPRFLAELSAYCIPELTDQQAVAEPSEWILTGAGPDMKNYRTLNLTEDGLLVTFDEYQVGCYAEGAHHVFVPSKLLATLLRPGCRVREMWKV